MSDVKRAILAGAARGSLLIEPRELRVSSGGKVIVVPQDQMDVLLCLVAHKGGRVDRHTLRNCAYAGRPGGDQRPRQANAAWHAISAIRRCIRDTSTPRAGMAIR